jgi:hypothetical protein
MDLVASPLLAIPLVEQELSNQQVVPSCAVRYAAADEKERIELAVPIIGTETSVVRRTMQNAASLSDGFSQ